MKRFILCGAIAALLFRALLLFFGFGIVGSHDFTAQLPLALSLLAGVDAVLALWVVNPVLTKIQGPVRLSVMRLLTSQVAAMLFVFQWWRVFRNSETLAINSLEEVVQLSSIPFIVTYATMLILSLLDKRLPK